MLLLASFITMHMHHMKWAVPESPKIGQQESVCCFMHHEMMLMIFTHEEPAGKVHEGAAWLMGCSPCEAATLLEYCGVQMRTASQYACPGLSASSTCNQPYSFVLHAHFSSETCSRVRHLAASWRVILKGPQPLQLTKSIMTTAFSCRLMSISPDAGGSYWEALFRFAFLAELGSVPAQVQPANPYVFALYTPTSMPATS